jgi:ABC-type nitrate/sulfonate/bicarbonate transport system ATPase subunit
VVAEGVGAPKLTIRDLRVTFARRRGGEVVALDGLSLEVGDREFVGIVGPSGCGKSTLLRVVAGLQRPAAGQVLLDGAPVTGPGADRGMVFQSYTLFPWLTVQGNVEFGLRLRGLPEHTRRTIARRYGAISTWWALEGSSRPTPRNSQAACSSAPPSPGPWSTPPRSSSWTSPSAPWTPRPGR